MAAQPNAVARREEKPSTPVDVEQPMTRAIDVIKQGGIHIVRAEVTIPAHFQYRVPAGKKEDPNTGKKVDAFKVGVTADGYDFLNRFVGVQFLVPDFIHDENGERVRNPIHRKDYIYERMVGIWYNDLGQLQAYSEDLEVDFQILYQQARLNTVWWEGPFGSGVKKTPDIKLRRDDEGLPLQDEAGNPLFDVLMPDEQELKALQRLFDLRATGIRYAQTVLKTRIMKVATGIRMLPTDTIKPVKYAVTGFRDSLTPQDRINLASKDAEALFGKPMQQGSTLTDEEIAATSLEPDVTEGAYTEVEAGSNADWAAQAAAEVDSENG